MHLSDDDPVYILKREGLITLKELFIDGTKIEANANRYTFVWRGSIKLEEVTADSGYCSEKNLLYAIGRKIAISRQPLFYFTSISQLSHFDFIFTKS